MPTALITGAGRGIGLEFARQYLGAGWQVIALQRAESAALSALSDTGSLEVLLGSLTDEAELDRALAPLEGRTIDVLIHNAGAMNDKGFGFFERANWHSIFDINVFTPLAISERLVDNVARADHGRIVTVSSILGSMEKNTSGGLYAYRASKAAVNAVMRSMALDLAGRGVTCAALHPGWVQTDMGGQDATLTPADSVAGLIQVINTLDADSAGTLIDWRGRTLPW
ncbi:MAG: SDR family oxidoreductase [Pseudomonadota bacterium]